MAEEVKFVPLTRSSLQAGLEQLKTAEPAKEYQFISVSEDPNAPKFKFLKDTPDSEIVEYLKSADAEQAMQEKGYVYKFGSDAARFDDPDDLDDTAFTKGLKAGYSSLKQLGAGALGTVADLLGMEDLERATNEAIQQYQIDGMAQQFIQTESGEVIPFEASVEKILTEPDRLSHFLDWAAFNVAQGLVSTIPIFAASMVNPIMGAGVAYGMGVGDSRMAQLEETNFQEANAGLSLAAGVPYALAERFLGAGFALRDSLIKKFGENAVTGTLKQIFKTTAATAGKEAIAEGAQELITQTAGKTEKGLQPGESVSAELSKLYKDSNFYKGIGEAAAAGFIGGGPFGIAGGVVESKQLKELSGLDLGEQDTVREQAPKKPVPPTPETVRKAKTNLKRRGFTEDFLKQKSPEDVIAYAEENKNLVTKKQYEDLEKLGYLSTPEGRDLVESFKQNTNIAKGSKKTQGVETVEAIIKNKQPFDGKVAKTKTVESQYAQTPAELEEIWGYPEQEISSEGTSLQQLAATFKKVDTDFGWQSGTVNVDIGGGRFNQATNFLADKNVTNYIYDPFNRTTEENRETVSQVANGQADTATINNVLNVIQEEENIDKVLKQADNALREGGTAYFNMYEGDRSGQGKQTTKGYQRNQKTKDYLPKIKQFFPDAYQKGSIIIAPKSAGVTVEMSSKLGEDTVSVDYLSDLKKELKRRGLQRDTRFGVGKRMGPNVYFHRQYVGDVIKKNPAHFKFFQDLVQAHKERKAEELGYQQAAFNSKNFLDFNIIKYNVQTGDISLINSFDFDIRPEPLVYYVETYKFGDLQPTRVTTYKADNAPIYHHKWLFVKDSYSDFDASESMNRSLEWTEAIKQVTDPAKMSRIGSQQYWNTNVVPLLSAPNVISKPKLVLKDLNTFWNNNTYDWNAEGYEGTKASENRSRTIAGKPEIDFDNLTDKPHPFFDYRFTIVRDDKTISGGISGYKRKNGIAHIDVISLDGYEISENANVLTRGELINLGRQLGKKLGVKKFEGLRVSGARPGDTEAITPKELFSVVDGSGNGSVKLKPEVQSKLGKIYADMRNELNRLLGNNKIQLKIYDTQLPGRGKNVLGNFVYTVNAVTQSIMLTRPQIMNLVAQPATRIPPYLESEVTDLTKFTLHHETIHALFANNFFTATEVAQLRKMADQKWIDYFNIKQRYPNLSINKQREETISDAFALFMARRYAPKGFIRQAFERLKNYLQAMGVAFRNNGYNNPSEIFNDVDLGVIRDRKLKQDRAVQQRTILTNVRYAAANKIPIQNNNVEDPAFRYQNEYLDDGEADYKMNQPEKFSRQQFRNSIRQFDNLVGKISRANSSKAEPTADLDQMSWFSKVFGHAKSWAEKYPLFNALFQPIVARLNKSRSLQTKFIDQLSTTFMKVVKTKEGRDKLNLAFEASQLTPGKYRIQVINGVKTIIIPVTQNGKAAGSTLKAGQEVVITGDVAQAYEDAILAMQTQSAEILRGLLGNKITEKRVQDAIEFIMAFRPDAIRDNPELNFLSQMSPDLYENITEEQLQAVFDTVQEIVTIREQGRFTTPEEVLRNNEILKKAQDILGTVDEQTGNRNNGIGLLLQEVKRFNEFMKTDYVPLTRFGKKFIVVKDSAGNVVDYRMFGEGFQINILRNQEAEIRADLEAKYPANQGFKISKTRDADYGNLQQQIGTTILSIDAASQFLSESNVNAYKDIRRQLSERLGPFGEVKGFSAYMQPRKAIGGIAGYEKDFVRGISQFGMVSSNYAASNRFDPEIKSAYQRGIRTDNVNLKQAIEKYYKYINDPEVEYAGLRQLGYWWFLGANTSSAVLQLFSNIIFVGPTLAEFANSFTSAAELSRAFKDVMKMVVFSNPKYSGTFVNFDNAPDDVKEELMKDVLNGLLKPGMAFVEGGISNSGDFGINPSKGIEDIKRTMENTFIGGIFNTFETISRLTAYIATSRIMRNEKARTKADSFYSTDANYQALVAEDNGVPTPRAIARHIVNKNFGMYGKENKPQYMRSFGSVIFLFNTYISQMIGLMTSLLMGQRGATRAQRIMGRKILARMVIMLFLTGGLFALPGADDAAWLVNFIRKFATGIDGDIRSEIRQMMGKSFGPEFAKFAENGLFANLGVDISRRIGFSELPGSQQAKGLGALFGFDTGVKPAETFGAGGAVFLQNSRSLIDAYNSKGTIEGSDYVNALLPTFATNLYKGFKYATTGRAYTKYGTSISDNVNLMEAFSQALGFRPYSIKERQDLMRTEKLNLGETSQIKKRFNNRIKNAYRGYIEGMQEKDVNKQAEAYQEFMDILSKIYLHNKKYEGDMAMHIFVDYTLLNRLWKEAVYDMYPEERLKSKLGERTAPKTMKTLEYIKDMGLQP